MFYKGNEAKPKRALVDLNGLAYIYNYNNSWKAVVQVLSKSNNDDDYLICDFLEFK